MKSDHLPEPLTWLCGGCGVDWPCDPAREALAAEHAAHPVTLGTYMSIQLAHAVVDLQNVPVGELHDRFVAWTRPQPLDVSST